MKSDNCDTGFQPVRATPILSGEDHSQFPRRPHGPEARVTIKLLNRARMIVAVSIAASVAIGALIVHAAEDDKSPTQSADIDKPTAMVTTAPARSGELSQPLIAYGSVTAQPGEIAVLSVPFESRVRRLHVTSGQAVDKAADLIEIEPSPAVRLALQEAQNSLESAKKDLTQTQQRFDMKLGTNTELATAQQAVQLAQLRLDNLNQNGGGETQSTLKSDAAGMISKIDVQEGQLVPAGAPLVEVVPTGKIEVRLGVEPSQVSLLKTGQSVKLFPSAGPADGLSGTVRLITHRVNPETRMVDVFVTPAADVPLFLDGSVSGEISARTETGLIVPRNAVLPGDDGMTLFTVKDGVAAKHTVTLGLQNDDESIVTADDLHAGDTVVVAGNLELDDKMSVAITPAPTTKPVSEVFRRAGSSEANQMRTLSVEIKADLPRLFTSKLEVRRSTFDVGIAPSIASVARGAGN